MTDLSSLTDLLPSSYLVLSTKGDSKELTVRNKLEGLEFRNDKSIDYCG